MTLKSTYLLLAILGAAVPYLFFLDFFGEYGVSVSDFVAALFANSASGGFTADLLISSFVFWLFMFARRSQTKGESPAPWFFMLLNLGIGLSCALPAYLYAQASREAK
ncbi:MAG TPA: hypothetical protein DCS79_08955 [Gammaproteobacteria bacterium]|jgi:hypothetical protein|nr:hypothetical protein [Gammaproteobacteria bacterium]